MNRRQEEYLDGPLVSYIYEMGYLSLGFESGQQEDPASIENSYLFIQLALRFAGIIDEKEDITLSEDYNTLKSVANKLTSIF